MALQLSFEIGHALVAGGTGGIGRAICERFADAGVPVILTFHGNQERAAEIRQHIEQRGGTCHCVRLDLRKADDVAALMKDLSARSDRIAHVVYAAGPPFEFNFIGQIPNEEWTRVIDSDVNGCFNLVQAAVRQFRQQGPNAEGCSGNLVAVTTTATERTPIRDIMSAAPKAAIEMLMRGVAKESGRFGIRANCVGPGWIDAGLGHKALMEKFTEEARQRLLRESVPLGRFGSADDIAHAVLFLCSRQAAFITGQSLAVDGGLQV